jgi:hypothetical protein
LQIEKKKKLEERRDEVEDEDAKRAEPSSDKDMT